MKCMQSYGTHSKPKRRNKRIESGVVSACIKWLWLNGCYVWRQNTMGAKYGEQYVKSCVTGCADIIGVTSHGRFLAVECKAPAGTLTEQQTRFKEYIEERHGIHIIARSVDDLEARKDDIKTLHLSPGFAGGYRPQQNLRPSSESIVLEDA